MTTSTVCIADKNGKHWNTLCSTEYTAPEIRNMQLHLQAAANNTAAYHFLDLETAVVLVDGEPHLEMSDDELLTKLFE